MAKGITAQYNSFSKVYSDNMETQDENGNRRFYEILGSIDLKNRILLDVGCGDGTDMARFAAMGAHPYGIDTSEEFVKLAKGKNPNAIVLGGKGEELPFKDKFFDVVVSKYAMQTSPDVPKIFEEVARVLKPQGHFIVLSKHPLRQFLEKRKTYQEGNDSGIIDYFNQETIDSLIFDKRIHLREPSHTISEYFSPQVLKDFDLQEFREDKDFPAAEQIEGMIYPTFFVAKYQRRNEKPLRRKRQQAL